MLTRRGFFGATIGAAVAAAAVPALSRLRWRPAAAIVVIPKRYFRAHIRITREVMEDIETTQAVYDRAAKADVERFFQQTEREWSGGA